MVKPNFTPEKYFNEELLSSNLGSISGGCEVVELALTEPLNLSFGSFPTRPSAWLTLNASGTSNQGFGEGVTLPRPVFTDDSGKNIKKHVDELVSFVGKASSVTFNDALHMIDGYVFADGGFYPSARLTVEMGLIDLATKNAGLSVVEAIGLPSSLETIPYGKSVSGLTSAAIIEQASNAIANDANKIKIKVAPSNFSSVIEAIDNITKANPQVKIMVDANGAFDPNSEIDLRMIKQLDQKGLVMFEEPVSRHGIYRDLEAVAVLREKQSNMKTPLCLDDCLKTTEDCYRAISDGLADIINIKSGRIGSFIRSLQLIDFARINDSEVMVGGMIEATPGRSMNTALGAYCVENAFMIPGDLSLAQERLTEDLVDKERQLKMRDGSIVIPRGLGWGF